MQDLFITKIHIDKVRHLENIEIDLSDNQMRHLILTGKNGSGKTSLLNEIARQMAPQNEFAQGNGLSMRVISSSDKEHSVELSYNQSNYNRYNWDETDAVFAFLPAHRTLNDMEMPTSIQYLNLVKTRPLTEHASNDFAKYMLYLNYQLMSAKNEGNNKDVQKYDKWFSIFEKALKEIYDSDGLKLKHNSKDLTFKIYLPGREPFGLNEMADGYSSFLNIVMELMMRMEDKASLTYDMPGIVLIDEAEAHLHVALQKDVLRFLTKMFPRIQFIVTTHSPFVITSLSDAIVYDLEKRIRVEDMSAYSYEGVIEHYYDMNMYSLEADKQFEVYKALVNREERTEEETDKLVEAINYLKQVPPAAAEELVYGFREMEEQRRLRANGKAQ